jgi:hypothetical protein
MLYFLYNKAQMIHDTTALESMLKQGILVDSFLPTFIPRQFLFKHLVTQSEPNVKYAYRTATLQTFQKKYLLHLQGQRIRQQRNENEAENICLLSTDYKTPYCRRQESS